MFSIITLAATLAYATFFESWYGAGAAQQYIYRSPGFAILLAFLGMNILCAALIRYPWKKRQTGFVVTHAGLLILLLGSFYSVRTADEGQVGMLEGDVKSELVRIDYPVIRILEIDPHSGERTREFDLPFRPGPFAWGPGKPRVAWFFRAGPVAGFVWVSGLIGFDGRGLDPAGRPIPVRGQGALAGLGPGGGACRRSRRRADGPHRASVQGPGHARGAGGVSVGREITGSRPSRSFTGSSRSQPPAMLAFSYVDRPELVDDFLKPPADPGTKGVARFRYPDRSGKTRVFDWALDGQEGKSIALPDSDLAVTLSQATEFPTSGTGLERILGDDPIPIAMFKIHSGKSEPVTHMALANLPMVPNVIPPVGPIRQEPRRAAGVDPLHGAPTLDPKTNGRFGQIEVLAGPDDALYYRVFGRGKEGKGELRAAGPLAKEKPIVAFGGNANMPMTITFQVDQYLPSAIEKPIYEPIVLPKGQMGNGIAACRAEMTVDGQTKEIWLSRSENLDPPAAPDRPVSRLGLPARLRRRSQAAGLRAQARRLRHGLRARHRAGDPLREPGSPDRQVGWHQGPAAQDLDEPPARPSRLHVLSSRTISACATRTPGSSRGSFSRSFRWPPTPAGPIIYGGCFLVVLGAFLQFYMRAGIFTDGGKRERERAAIAAKKKAELGIKTDEL